MVKRVFERRRNALAFLVVFFLIIPITATAVGAANEVQHLHKGGHHHPGGHHFHNWHDHHHHHLHDHYYNGIYYSNYEWMYNPVTLVWDWIHVPVEVQPIIEEVQPVVKQPIIATTPAVITSSITKSASSKPYPAKPVAAKPALGTGLATPETPMTPGLISDATYGSATPSKPATSGSIAYASDGSFVN